MFILFQFSNSEKPAVYVYSSGDEKRTYHPVNSCLQDIARNLQIVGDGPKPWETYLKEGLRHLQVCLK